MTVSFIGGGNWSTGRKSPTCCKSLKTLSHNVVSSTPRHEWERIIEYTFIKKTYKYRFNLGQIYMTDKTIYIYI